MHCSVMGMEALEAAIQSYNKGGVPVSHEEPEGKIVCKCFSVTEEKIIKAIRENNLKTVEEITNFTKAGGACGKCKGDIQKILNEVLAVECKTPQTTGSNFQKMTLVQKIHAIEEVLTKEIAPKLMADGGSIELVEIQGNLVRVKLLGMCKSCPSAGFTLKSFVETKLKEIVDESITVEQVS